MAAKEISMAINDRGCVYITEPDYTIDDYERGDYGIVGVILYYENNDALEILKSGGITFIDYPKADIEKGKELRGQIITKLKGSLFSEEALKMLETYSK
jgi:hypothetical protein